MNVCKECYSADSKATPLLKARECLENHEQYICGTCGRCICIAKDEKRGLRRWNFPFKTLEIAKLYLRTADVINKMSCGIYEIKSANGRISYKIFPTDEELKKYLSKNKDKTCSSMEAVFRHGKYMEFENSQVRKLTKEEVERYLLKRK